MDEHSFVVETCETGRLDAYLAARLDGVSRSAVQRLIHSGRVLVNCRPQRAGYRVEPGDRITVIIPDPEPSEITPEKISLEIVYEDADLIVINKPSGMTVHPAPGSARGTLVNAILAHSSDLSGIGGVQRPGIVHRLDKDTSGLIAVAKTDLAHTSLQQQLQKRTAARKYRALVWGATTFNEAVVDAPIGRHPTNRQKMAVIRDTGRYTARQAITHLAVTERFAHFTLLEAALETGRTHQIRLHCSFIGHPIVGDPTYGGTKRAIPSALGKAAGLELSRLIEGLQGQALHAFHLSFVHPTQERQMEFESEMPPEMTRLIDWLRANDRA